MKKELQEPQMTRMPKSMKVETSTKPAIVGNTVLCEVKCDPFFIKTDIHGYCKQCGKNLGYVRK